MKNGSRRLRRSKRTSSTSPQGKKVARRRYSPKARQDILATAAKEGLTGKQVSQRFGISMVTYYLWRKKAGITVGRGARRAAVSNGQTRLPATVRKRVQAEVRSAIDRLIQEEAEAYLSKSLGALGKE